MAAILPYTLTIGRQGIGHRDKAYQGIPKTGDHSWLIRAQGDLPARASYVGGMGEAATTRNALDVLSKNLEIVRDRRPLAEQGRGHLLERVAPWAEAAWNTMKQNGKTLQKLR